MATVIGIVSRRWLTIEVYHKNQPNKSKLALYKLFWLLVILFKTVYTTKELKNKAVLNLNNIRYIAIYVVLKRNSEISSLQLRYV